MNENLRFGMFLCLLIIAVLIAGCSDQSDNSVTTMATTAAPQAKYTAGDIIAKTSAGGDQLYVILGYDSATDNYERAWIYKNSDGSWGHFISSTTDKKADRTTVEKTYPVKIAHVTVSSIPVVTPTPVVIANVTYVGEGPSISSISPNSTGQDATVTATITGNNFQTGAVPKLIQPGSAAITGTATSVSATSITTTFNMNQQAAGDYNVIVTDPDGRSDILQNAFTIGNAAPVVNTITPDTVELNDTESTFTINGQNFQTGISVSFVQGSLIIPCVNPQYVDATKISCGPIAFPSGATAGLYDVKVVNIADSTSGILSQKFTVTNSTA